MSEDAVLVNLNVSDGNESSMKNNIFDFLDAQPKDESDVSDVSDQEDATKTDEDDDISEDDDGNDDDEIIIHDVLHEKIEAMKEVREQMQFGMQTMRKKYNPLIAACMAGNTRIFHELLQQRLYCPLIIMDLLYTIASGYPNESLAEQMITMIRNGCGACLKDETQIIYRPCRKHM